MIGLILIAGMLALVWLFTMVGKHSHHPEGDIQACIDTAEAASPAVPLSERACEKCKWSRRFAGPLAGEDEFFGLDCLFPPLLKYYGTTSMHCRTTVQGQLSCADACGATFKFYEEKDNGRHRQTTQASTSNTINASQPVSSGTGPAQSASAGGFASGTGQGSIGMATYNSAAQAARQHSLAQMAQAALHPYANNQYGSQPLNAQQISLIQRMQQMAIVHPSGYAAAAFVPSAPLDKETKFGELIGYRAWRVLKGGILSSCVVDDVWLPQEPMVGEIKNEHTAGSGGQGIHAYKGEQHKSAYVGNRYNIATDSMSTYATGSVSLYGDVIEHETGYRASHAMVRTIDAVFPPDAALLSKLKERYEPKPPKAELE